MNVRIEKWVISNPAGLKQEKVWKMKKASLPLVAALTLFGVAACQRPTERLPVAPQFQLTTPGSTVGVTPKAFEEAVSDVSQNVAGEVIPGTLEDFIRFAGTDRVFFDYDKSELRPEDKLTLNKQAVWLRRYLNVRVSLEGHADERGTREYNFALGERRAAAIRAHLLGQGLGDQRITTTSFGKERPVSGGSDEAAWSSNRRGETFLVGAVGQ